MATELQIQLKESGGDLLTLAEGEIFKVMSDTLGSKVLYYKSGAGLQQITVVETPVKVAALCKTLLMVTDADDGNTSYINADFIVLIDDSGTNTVIKYFAKGALAYPQFLVVTESKSAINKTIYELAGNTSYSIDTINITNKTFSLSLGDGDVTSVFTAAKIFSVVNSTGNDGTYEVASSTYSGSKTVITVKETISNAVADGNVLAV